MMRRLACGFIVGLLACGGDSAAPTEYALPAAPTSGAVCATFSPVALAAVTETSVYAWLNIFALVIPGGYAGYVVGSAKPTMLLVDTTKFALARDNAAILQTCAYFPRHLGYTLPVDAVAKARYDFRRLYAWDADLVTALGKSTGVLSRQFDLAANQILVVVVDASVASAVRAAARRAGIPDDAVATRVSAR